MSTVTTTVRSIASVETRINRTTQLLQDIDVIIEDLSDLVLRDPTEFLLIQHYRSEKKKALIKSAADALSPKTWPFKAEEK